MSAHSDSVHSVLPFFPTHIMIYRPHPTIDITEVPKYTLKAVYKYDIHISKLKIT